MTKIAKMIEEETGKMIFVTYRKPNESRDYEDEALWYVAMQQAEGYRDLTLKGLAGCLKDGISPLTAEDVEEYYKEYMEGDRGEFDQDEILRKEIKGFYQPHAKPEVCIHCGQQNIAPTQCCPEWDGRTKPAS